MYFSFDKLKQIAIIFYDMEKACKLWGSEIIITYSWCVSQFLVADVSICPFPNISFLARLQACDLAYNPTVFISQHHFKTTILL